MKHERQIYAVPTHPAPDMWSVSFYYRSKNGAAANDMPVITVPAQSYVHADNTAKAFNAGLDS